MTPSDHVHTIIYGTGSVASKLLESGLIDSSEQLCFVSSTGKENMPGFEVLPSEYLKHCSFKRLIIASSFVVQILSRLEGYSLDRSCIFIYEPDKGSLISLEELNSAGQLKTLYAIYDLEANPATFDCVFFVVMAQAYARQQGCSAIHFVLVPGVNRTGRLGDGGYCLNDEEIYRWKIQSVLVPVFQQADMYKGLSILSERNLDGIIGTQQETIFPVDYSPLTPSDTHNPKLLLAYFREAEAGVRAAPVFTSGRLAEQFIKSLLAKSDKRTVCVTLREYAFQAGRNNLTPDWLALLNHISAQGYRVILVRDTFMAHQELPEDWQHFEVCESASWSVGIRLALYKHSWLNLCSNTGPANLLYFLPESRYLLFNLLGLNEGGEVSDVVTSSEFFRKRYHLQDADTHFFFAANPYQRLVRQKDSFESMKQAFECIERELSSNE